MNQSYPVLPPELVGQWTALANEEEGCKVWSAIATQAAQWGADQELEACCEWMRHAPFGFSLSTSSYQLRNSRRPKPPSLKEQALSEVAGAVAGGNITPERGATIRRALEQLPDAL